MLTRSHNEIEFICDGCGEYLETGTEDFNEALSILRNYHWRSFKEEDSEWMHHCDDCNKGAIEHGRKAAHNILRHNAKGRAK